MQVGETFIKVRPDSRGFAGELRGDVQSAGAGIGQDLGGAITRQLGAVLAGGAAVDFLRDSVGAASDLNEAVSLTQVSFQGAADSVLAMGETSAESFGLANDEALNFANSIGGLFIGFGDTRTEAAAMAEDVVSLGADLASAKNLAGGTGEALEILRSGLVGEVEPLRRIGVALNAASVEQRALADTGKESAAQLTEGEKAAARYALIFESLNAQGVVGDFARTQGGAANQQRILSAEFRDAQAALGQQLLPAFLDLIGAVRDGIPLLALVGTHLASGAQGASLLAGALSPLVGLAADVNGGLEDMTGGVTHLTDLGPGLGQLTSIIEAAQGVWADGLQLGPVTVGSGESSPSGVVESTVDEIEAALDRLDLSFGGDHTISLQEWATAVGTFAADAGLSFADALDELNIRGELASSILAALRVQGAGAGAAIGALGAQQEALNDQASRTNLDDQADALHEIADAADEARQKLEDLYGIEQTLDEANTALQESHDGLTASVLENGRTFNEATEEGRANLAAARDQASAIREQTIAYRANGASVDDAQQSNRFYIASLRDQLLASGLSRGETERLIDTYARVPRNVLTKLDADDAPARAGVDSAAAYAIGHWAGRTFTATLGIATGSVAGALADVQGRIDRLDERAAAPAGHTFVTNVYPQNLVGTQEELVRQMTPAVAGAVDEMLRRS